MRRSSSAVRIIIFVTAGLLSLPVTSASAADPPSGNEGRGHADHQPDVTHDRGPFRDFDSVWDAATPKQRAAASDLITATTDATERWQDVAVALADGFHPNRGGFGAVHYRNTANRRDDATLDPTHPEALVYLQRPNGAPILLGAVYVTMPYQERKVPAGDIAAWHVHRDAACHHPDLSRGCEDVRGGMLHVWVYDGVIDPFADPMSASMGNRPEWRAKLREIARVG